MKLEEPKINKDFEFIKNLRDPKGQILTRVMLDKRISRRVVQCIPLCSSCKNPYDINIDGSDLPGEVGKLVTVKCSNCGAEYEIAPFRSHDPNEPENIIYNALTVYRDDAEQKSVE